MNSPPLPAAAPRISSPPIRVAMLDDHETLLEALILLLGEQPELQIVGAWTHSSELLAALANLRADVILLDYALAADDHECCQLIGTLRALRPSTRVLVVSAHDNALVVSAVMRAGACGYVCKNADTAVLLDAIKAAAGGGQPLSAAHRAALSTMVKLTDREREVLRHVLAGSGVSSLARQEGLSEKTISTHKRAAYRKLGLHGDADLYRLAPLVVSLINDVAPLRRL